MQSLWVQEATKAFWGSQCSKQFDCLCCLKFDPDDMNIICGMSTHMGVVAYTSEKAYGPSCLMIFHQLSTWGTALSWRGPWPFGAFLFVQLCHEIL